MSLKKDEVVPKLRSRFKQRFRRIKKDPEAVLWTLFAPEKARMKILSAPLNINAKACKKQKDCADADDVVPKSCRFNRFRRDYRCMTKTISLPLATHDTVESEDETVYGKYIYVFYNDKFYEKIYTDTYVLVVDKKLESRLREESIAPVKNPKEYNIIEEKSLLKGFFSRNSGENGKRVFLQRQ